MKYFYIFFTIMLITIFSIDTSYSAMRMRLPKAPRQSYAKQIGGNARQKTKVEYDRGGKKYSKNVNPGQTNFIPRDAKNIQINGMRVRHGERVTTSPHGASLFED